MVIGRATLLHLRYSFQSASGAFSDLNNHIIAYSFVLLIIPYVYKIVNVIWEYTKCTLLIFL